MDDARVREKVGIEGEQGRREERGHRPVAGTPGEEYEQEQPGEHHEKGSPRHGEDPVDGNAIAIEEVGAVIDEEVPHRDPIGRRRQRQGRQREPREHLHEGRVLDVDDGGSFRHGEIARQDVDRLVGRKRVLARVVVDEKRRRRAQKQGDEDGRRGGSQAVNALAPRPRADGMAGE